MEVQKIKIEKPSVIPYYGAGGAWFLYASMARMYRLVDFGIASILCIAVWWGLKKICKPNITYIDAKIDTGNAQLNQSLEDGMAFIGRLRSSQLAIENTKIQTLLEHMIQTVNAIFDHIQANPHKLSTIRRFLNYYIPTVSNLLKSYDELEEQKQAAAKLQATLHGIEAVLGQVTAAFDRQLEALYEKDVIDINADIRVLEQMLEREGLLKSELDRLREQENNR